MSNGKVNATALNMCVCLSRDPSFECVSSAEGASILCSEIIRGLAQDLSIAMIHASAIAKGCTGRCGRVRGTVSKRKQENERFGVACGRMHAHICSCTHTHVCTHARK